MIIVVWIVIVVCIAAVMGEVKYRCFDDRKKYAAYEMVSMDWEDHINHDMDSLSVEDSDDQFVRLQVLAMRGSWRLAKNQVMSRQMFHILRAQEYAKML